MKLIKPLYNSFLIALTIACIAFNNVWLQMRMNVGYIFLAVLGILFLIFSYYYHKCDCRFSIKFTTVNLIINALIMFLMFGKKLKTIPGSVVRNAIMQPRFSLDKMSYILLAIVVLGYILILINDFIKKSKVN